jgi:hypothetical protein
MFDESEGTREKLALSASQIFVLRSKPLMKCPYEECIKEPTKTAYNA